MMSSKKCPNCGLYNSETALRCDCGYDFASGLVKGHPVAQGKKFAGRAGAYILDLITMYVISLGVGTFIGIGLAVVMTIIGRDFSVDEAPSVWSFVMGLVLSTLYFTSFEGLYGASVGKLILGMRVIQVDGRPCGLRAAFVRALWRFIDGLIFGLVAYANMKPSLYQRLGDNSAKTVVVGHKDPCIQEHRPWWWLAIAALLYLVLATLGIASSLIFTLR